MIEELDPEDECWGVVSRITGEVHATTTLKNARGMARTSREWGRDGCFVGVWSIEDVTWTIVPDDWTPTPTDRRVTVEELLPCLQGSLTRARDEMADRIREHGIDCGHRSIAALLADDEADTDCERFLAWVHEGRWYGATTELTDRNIRVAYSLALAWFKAPPLPLPTITPKQFCTIEDRVFGEMQLSRKHMSAAEVYNVLLKAFTQAGIKVAL